MRKDGKYKGAGSEINYQRIIASLNRLKCGIHNKEAVAIIDAQGPIFLNCCCPGFEEELQKRYYEEIDKQLFENE